MSLIEQAKTWLAHDPDFQDQAELQALIQQVAGKANRPDSPCDSAGEKPNPLSGSDACGGENGSSAGAPSRKNASDAGKLPGAKEVSARLAAQLKRIHALDRQAAQVELADRFASPLLFGTAGLRGKIGAGQNRMSTAVVTQAAAGLCKVLKQQLAGFKDPRPFEVVIGYDARYRSKDFAHLTAGIVVAAGGKAWLFDQYYPTPLTAFALQYLDADAAVMVTASHNPPADNGYKVYLGGRVVSDLGRGAQIVPPWDQRIQQAITEVGWADQIPVAASGWQCVPNALIEAYINRAASLAGTDLVAKQLPETSLGSNTGETGNQTATDRVEPSFESLNQDPSQLPPSKAPDSGQIPAVPHQAAGLSPQAAANLRIVLTSMHGVGADTCVKALQRAGFTDIHQVAEQAQPDPDFPTVAFPNPEEPGALDLALRLAAEVSADVVIANDPDADRCSAAVKMTDGAWQQLSGDQIGALLGSQAAEIYLSEQQSSGDLISGQPPVNSATAAEGDFPAHRDQQSQHPRPCLARSIVSSSLLDQIATRHGLGIAVTLTGFKWIARAEGIIFGYEEAIGYCCDPKAVLDKDGISASVRIAALAAQLKAKGSCLAERWQELALEYGLYHTAPLTFRVADLSLITRGMQRLRELGGPATLAGQPVSEQVDLSAGFGELPPTDGMLYRTERGDRIIARPSGTEPKLKCYLETIVDTGEFPSLAQAQAEAEKRIKLMKQEMTAALGF